MENNITNYSEMIRKKVESKLEDISHLLYHFNMDNELKYEVLIQSLQLNDSEYMTTTLKNYGLLSEQSQRETDFLKRTIYIQSYSDFYLMNRFYKKIEKNDPEFAKITYEMIEHYFQNKSIYVRMLKSMFEFKSLSAYDKVILIKSLTEEENEMLKSINPFYEYEKKLYNIEITKEIILRQMSKWENSFGLEVSLEETKKFIFKLYSLDPSNINKLFEELNLEEIPNPQNEEEGIMFNGTFITKEMLESKLKEISNAKEKLKK